MKKKILSLALLSALILSLAACGAPDAEVTDTPAPTSSLEPETTASPEPSPEATPEDFDGTILVSSEFNGLASTYEGYIVLKASAMLPTVTIEGRDKAAEAITDALQKKLAATEDSTKDAYDAACDAFDALDDAGREIWLAYGWSSSGEVERGDGAVLSLLCYNYAYTGGAHGSYEYYGQTFSTVTGKALSLDDLTDDPEALRAALTEHILAAAKEDEEELFDVEGFTERVFDTDSWYLTDEALVIVAQVGEIAAGARGKVEFAVPYSELEGLLKAEYVPKPAEAKGGADDLSIAFSKDAQDVPVAGAVRIIDPNAISSDEYMVNYRVVAGADMGPIALRGSTISTGDTIIPYDEEEPIVIYDTGSEYAWINKLDAGEALEISSVFMDTPLYCLVLSDGTVLQIAQSGKDGSLLLYEG